MLCFFSATYSIFACLSIFKHDPLNCGSARAGSQNPKEVICYKRTIISWPPPCCFLLSTPISGMLLLTYHFLYCLQRCAKTKPPSHLGSPLPTAHTVGCPSDVALYRTRVCKVQRRLIDETTRMCLPFLWGHIEITPMQNVNKCFHVSRFPSILVLPSRLKCCPSTLSVSCPLMTGISRHNHAPDASEPSVFLHCPKLVTSEYIFHSVLQLNASTQ